MPILDGPITANGDYYANIPSTGDTYLDVQGTFGSGTLVCSVKDVGGRAIPGFASLTAAASAPARVLLPQGKVWFSLTGATSPNIVVTCQTAGRS